MCETHHSFVLAVLISFFTFTSLVLYSQPALSPRFLLQYLYAITSAPPSCFHNVFFLIYVLLSPACLHALTGPPTSAIMSAMSVLCPAGVGGRLSFVAV